MMEPRQIPIQSTQSPSNWASPLPKLASASALKKSIRGRDIESGLGRHCARHKADEHDCWQEPEEGPDGGGEGDERQAP